MNRLRNRSLMAIIGPGMLIAATGVGAGDLAAGAFAGSKLGLAVIWAVLLGAFFKFVITEGLVRWQLATGQTLLEGLILRLGRPAQWFFLAYLLVWTFGVGVSLTSACGVAAHALIPVFRDPVTAKVVFGTVHSLIGLVLVLLGTFKAFERLMSAAVSVMFVMVILTALMLQPDWFEVAQKLLIPSIPRATESNADPVGWTLALMGGVGGTLTVLCYGYWVREERRFGTGDLSLCRLDLGLAYILTALFGMAMIIISTGMELSNVTGASLIVDLADRLLLPLGPVAKLIFLVGAWAAVFTSLLGVWQATPYLFADFWALFRRYQDLDPDHFEPVKVNTKGLPYRAYLFVIALVPLIGLQFDFIQVQKLNSIFGALVMPMIALALLVLNGRSKWVGKTFRNRPTTVAVLIVILAFFSLTGGPRVLSVVIDWL